MLNNFLKLTDNNRWPVVLSSTFLCGSVFLVTLARTRQKRIASEIASLFHHVIVVFLALICLWLSFDRIAADSALSKSDKYPLANTIQWINIGYFMYDSMNAVVWEHNFIIHHIVALAGFGVSDLSGRGGLGNAMNTLIAEVGSIMYNIYNKHKSINNYLRFVAVYTTSRVIFIYWTWIVFNQLAAEFLHRVDTDVPVYFLLSILIFQTLLVVVNFHFLFVHLRKARRILASKNSVKKE